MQVRIAGTIVPPEYDDELFAAWVERGVITPSSRLVAALEGARGPVDLYVNSYGGDVFAGGEMLIALRKCLAAGRLRSVEVGAIAASMAANIVVALKASGAPVTAHANSSLMFHGCYTVTDGGAQLHEDVAQSLRNVNEAVVADLNRIGVTECRAWFAEGRQKWIDADEGLELGIFDAVAEACADRPREAKQTASRLAAFAATLKNRKEHAMNIEKMVAAAEPAAAEPAAAEPAAAEPAAKPAAAEPAADPAAEPPEQVAQKLANERFAALQSQHDKMISDLKAKNSGLEEALAAAKAEATTLAERLAKSEAGLADVRNQLAAEQKAHQAVVAKALAAADPANLTNREKIASGMKVVG